MSEWNESRIEKELEAILTELPKEDDLEKKINQSINRRIRRAVYRTLAVLAAALLAVVLIINPLLNASFFNPYKLNQEPEQKMRKVMRDYVETTRPYREVLTLEVEKKGFAHYEVAMQVADCTGACTVGVQNVWFDVSFGKYENYVDMDFNLIHKMGVFESSYVSQEEILEQIMELPKSAKIYLAVSDTKEKSLETLKGLPVTLDWLQVYQPNVAFQGGLRIEQMALYDKEDNRREMTEQELLQTYVSNLKNLLEYDEVWLQFGLTDGNYVFPENAVERMRETYEDARHMSALTSENYAVYGQRDEIVQFLQENTLDSIYVEKVNLW